ncbi:MAG: DoxX family protein [Gammaproteobacteria bacterium]|nr:DoxX family protein [Gammaproteobacteria bacterium]
MNDIAASQASSVDPLRWASFRTHPMRSLGIVLVLFNRWVFGLFYIFAAINKFRGGYLFTDKLRATLQARVPELPPDSFAVTYIESFIIPLYVPISWLIAWGELAAGVGLLLGLCTRWAAAFALFFIVNFAIGGFYDASLIVLGAIAVLFIVTPSGRWMGLDRRLHARYPGSIWFR